MNATQRAVPHLGGPVRRPRALLCINPASGLGRGADAGSEAAARFGACTYGQVLHGDGEPLGRLPARVTADPGTLTLLDYRAPDAPHGTWSR